MQYTRKLLTCVLAVCMMAMNGAAQAEDFDLVIKGGRVIDPETGLDAVRNVGVSNGRIATVTVKDISGKEQIDATGLVVAPGFIDLHAHGQNIFGQTWQVRDGVTTALELEAGVYDIATKLKSREGKAYINYGYSSDWASARGIAKGFDVETLNKIGSGTLSNEELKPLMVIQKKAEHEKSTKEELAKILSVIENDLDEGALGIGVPLDYLSRGTSDEELEALFRLGARRDVPLYFHIRMADDPEDISGYAEIVAMARKTGASAHMVHIASTGLGRVQQYLDMMDEARADGFDLTTEVYPYTAGSTGINSGIFDHDWQSKFQISYGDIEWPPTGERFTGKKMWDEYRAKYPLGVIIIHVMKEFMVEQALKHPSVMVASDGMPVNSLEQRAHPRGMGTFARVLGHYVRERQVISLPNAIAKMSYLPARRLESFTPVMKRKGRVQSGADADLTIFNADTVIDNATFAEPNKFSTGIKHVVVNGQIIVKNETLLEGVFPGQPVSTKTK